MSVRACLLPLGVRDAIVREAELLVYTGPQALSGVLFSTTATGRGRQGTGVACRAAPQRRVGVGTEWAYLVVVPKTIHP